MLYDNFQKNMLTSLWIIDNGRAGEFSRNQKIELIKFGEEDAQKNYALYSSRVISNEQAMCKTGVSKQGASEQVNKWGSKRASSMQGSRKQENEQAREQTRQQASKLGSEQVRERACEVVSKWKNELVR